MPWPEDEVLPRGPPWVPVHSLIERSQVTEDYLCNVPAAELCDSLGRPVHQLPRNVRNALRRIKHDVLESFVVTMIDSRQGNEVRQETDGLTPISAIREQSIEMEREYFRRQNVDPIIGRAGLEPWERFPSTREWSCLLYTSDAADE